MPRISITTKKATEVATSCKLKETVWIGFPQTFLTAIPSPLTKVDLTSNAVLLTLRSHYLLGFLGLGGIWGQLIVFVTSKQVKQGRIYLSPITY